MNSEDCNRIKVDLVDHEDGFKFEVRRVSGADGAPLVVDDFTAEALKEYGDIFTEGLSLHNALNEQSITAAITNVSDLLNLVLDNYSSDCSSFKCILASSLSHSNGIGFISTSQRVSRDVFAENHTILSVKIFEAMRKTKAGNASGSNIYRLVHCIVHQGDHTNVVQPYAYAVFTVCLQACMFAYVCAHSLFNLPHHDESVSNAPLAVLVFVYQLLLLLPEVRDTLAVSRSGFWDSDVYSILRLFDVVSNIIMPIILLPIGVMLVLTADNLLEAVLSSTAVLFIPTLDNDIINLMGESDNDMVKKHIAQETIHQIADHFFRFQILCEEEDHFDIEHQHSSGSVYGAVHTTSMHNSIHMNAHSDYDTYNTATPTPSTHLLMSTHTASGLPISATTTQETPILEPMLVDMVITGSDALLKCVVFDAFCTTRSLDHLHRKVLNVTSGAVSPINTTNTAKPRNRKSFREGFSEISRDSYHEVFFSESHLVSTSSVFTAMEYKIDTTYPHAIVYMKLYRLCSDSNRANSTVEYRTKRYSDLLPTHCVQPGCFLITNLVITDCIDTLRICWCPSPRGLFLALQYYTLFSCDDAAEKLLKRDTSSVYSSVYGSVNGSVNDSNCGSGGNVCSSVYSSDSSGRTVQTRRTSMLSQEMKPVYGV